MIAGITASTRRGGPEIEWPYDPILLRLANQVPPEGEVWEIDKFNTTYNDRVGFTMIIFLDEDWTVLGSSLFSESSVEISLMPGTRYVEVFEEFTEDSDNTITFRGPSGTTIQSVMDWGTHPYAGMGFLWCEYLVTVPDFIPETFTTLNDMFLGCSQFNSPNVEFWDTSNIQAMVAVFQGAASFNVNIGSWDTSNVLAQDKWGDNNMRSMFTGAENFNQDLSGWCVPQFAEEPYRFSFRAESWTLPKPVWGTCPGGFVIKTTGGVVAKIEGPGTVPGTNVYVYEDGRISGGQLEEVLSFPEEKPDWLEGNGIGFYGAEHLTKAPDTLPTWITDMGSMFAYCLNFNGDLSGWDVSNVTNMNTMFEGCTSFNQDLSGWDTSNVTNMDSMFQKCTSFNQDLSGWDVSSVTDMSNMFSRCSSFNGDLSEWDTSNVIDMYAMFYGCSGFNGDLSGWDISNVTNMTMMFTECSSFNQDLSGWCVSNFRSEPFNFSDGTPSWSLPKPVWGTCPSTDLPSDIGEAHGGGFYAGDIQYPDGQWYKLIVADKAADITGANSRWKTSETDTPGTGHQTDGTANTEAMIAAGIELHPAAQHCIGHRGGGFEDWYMPATDELDVIYQNLGFNRPNCPPDFQAGGPQAFSDSMYWSSTQGSSSAGSRQHFSDGRQSSGTKGYSGRQVRPVRRMPFIP